MNPPPQKIVLVGLPGAGKSTVGRQLAERLQWSFVDLDVMIARRAGRTIPEIFRDLGEEEFRRMERQATADLASEAQIVVAPGGGWMANGGAREALGSGAMVIYLAVTPATAAGRLGIDAFSRPLLAADPLRALRDLQTNRAAAYFSADRTVDTEHLTTQQVTEMVAQLATGSLPG